MTQTNPLLIQPDAACSLASNKLSKIYKLMETAESESTAEVERIALGFAESLNAQVIEFMSKYHEVTKQPLSGGVAEQLASIALVASHRTKDVQ